jgi:hypothetical protein
VLLPPVEEKVHLSGVSVLERTHLEVDEQVAAEDTVVEDQVYVVVLVFNGDSFLACLETKTRTVRGCSDFLSETGASRLLPLPWAILVRS